MYMRIDPKIVFTIATLLTPIPRLHAQAIVSVQENGRKVYVNDVAAAPDAAGKSRRAAKSYRLVYWSQTEQRWKPVPGASTMRAARSAAAEVNQTLGMSGVAVRKLAPAPAVSSASNTQTSLADNQAEKQLSPVQNEVQPEVATTSTHSRSLTTAEIDAAIQTAAAHHNVDPNLVRAVIKVESNFNPRAVSPKGAMGLMQLMPKTARDLAVSNPFDPQQNVDAGVRHLKGLLENFGGDIPLSLAAYNAGAGAVARNNGVPPYRETRDYVKRITKLYGSNGTMGNFASAAPLHVFRGPDGVLNVSNTE
jgi:soluble lytic murein transglycosylase-like protein